MTDIASGVRSSAAGGPGGTIRFSLAEGPDGVTVSLEGELDILTLPDAGLALELAKARGAAVTVDCTSLRFTDVAAVRFLRRAAHRARSEGSDLMLTNMQEPLWRLLELTDSLFLAGGRMPQGLLVPVIPDQAALLRAAMAAAGQLADTPRANAQLADPAAGQLRIVAQHGFSQPFLEFFDVVDDTSSACGTALHTGGSVWVPDVARSPIFSGTAVHVMLDAGAAAVATVPVRAPGGEPIAMISTHHETPRTWQAITRRQLERLAEVTGELIWQHDAPAAGAAR